MNVIKEIAKSNGKLVIRTSTYKHTFDHIAMLVETAKKDFPKLEDKDIEVVQFAGERYKRTFGIEFYVKTDVIPKDYVEIKELEYTF